MISVNILFDDDYEDMDIIAIPKELSEIIVLLAEEFECWEGPKDDPDYWSATSSTDKLVKNVETSGFIKWLNRFYCKGEKKAYIVVQHVEYNFNGFPTVEF